ncbi:MAG: sensor histidine kinase [Halobacteriales archaeon]
MSSDRADAGDHGVSRVPVDSIPAPVIAYDVPEGTPVIAETNEPFEAAFEAVSTGTAVRHWLRDAVGVDEPPVDDVCSALTGGDDVDIEVEAGVPGAHTLDPGRYRLRTFEGTGNDSEIRGRLLMIEASEEGSDDVETDRIASVISHDLRNPLDVANAHLRAARETGEEEHFDQVRQSHDRMEQIIKDVLTLARGESALSITDDVDVEAVAADAWATVDTRDASITLEDDLPEARGDPDRLQRLFENLFRNSIEHAHPAETGNADPGDGSGPEDSESGAPLQVRVGRTDGGFFIADNGPGVPVEDRTRVFDPGYSRGGTGGGTGLGLTIVEEIADAHDWTVSLTTGSLGGARFEFRPDSEDARSA